MPEALVDVVPRGYLPSVAHRLGNGHIAETGAYKAIGGACVRRNLTSAKKAFTCAEQGPGSLGKKSVAAANKAVTLYDDFSYLYRCVFFGELNVFDVNGNLP